MYLPSPLLFPIANALHQQFGNGQAPPPPPPPPPPEPECLPPHPQSSSKHVKPITLRFSSALNDPLLLLLSLLRSFHISLTTLSATVTMTTARHSSDTRLGFLPNLRRESSLCMPLCCCRASINNSSTAPSMLLLPAPRIPPMPPRLLYPTRRYTLSLPNPPLGFPSAFLSPSLALSRGTLSGSLIGQCRCVADGCPFLTINCDLMIHHRADSNRLQQSSRTIGRAMLSSPRGRVIVPN